VQAPRDTSTGISTGINTGTRTRTDTSTSTSKSTSLRRCSLNFQKKQNPVVDLTANEEPISPTDEQKYKTILASTPSPFSFDGDLHQEMRRSAFQPGPAPAVKQAVDRQRKAPEMRELVLRQQFQESFARERARERESLAKAQAAYERARDEIRLQERREERKAATARATFALRENKTIDLTLPKIKSVNKGGDDCEILSQVVVFCCVVGGCLAWYFSDPTVGTTFLPMLTSGAV
jgi:hypothetical protein